MFIKYLTLLSKILMLLHILFRPIAQLVQKLRKGERKEKWNQNKYEQEELGRGNKKHGIALRKPLLLFIIGQELYFSLSKARVTNKIVICTYICKFLVFTIKSFRKQKLSNILTYLCFKIRNTLMYQFSNVMKLNLI